MKKHISAGVNIGHFVILIKIGILWVVNGSTCLYCLKWSRTLPGQADSQPFGAHQWGNQLNLALQNSDLTWCMLNTMHAGKKYYLTFIGAAERHRVTWIYVICNTDLLNVECIMFILMKSKRGISTVSTIMQTTITNPIPGGYSTYVV